MKAAGVMLMTPEGLVLFLKRSETSDHPGTWCLPAGRIEEGETPEEAARRECVEETGKAIRSEFAELEATEDFITFLAMVDDIFIPVDVTEEHVGFAWAAPANAPEPLHPRVAATLKGDEEDRFTYEPGDLEIYGPDGTPIEEPAMEEEEVDEPASSMEVNIYEVPV